MKKTVFFDRLVDLGGKMVDFAGYSMPIQFSKGIIYEHKAVRQSVGLFDVSHMGEFFLRGKDAFKTLQNLVTNDISTMEKGQARYALMLNKQGGVIDDILIYKLDDEAYMLVGNACNYKKDYLWIKSNLIRQTVFEDKTNDIALLALQGRNAIKILIEIIPEEKIPTRPYTFIELQWSGQKILLSRTGYTGEDGFEIYCPNSIALKLFDILLKKGAIYNIQLCGLGARDTLRLEAGMPLYGNEMDESTLASEIGLDFFIKMHKESFVGKEALEAKSPQYSRKGIQLIERGIAREGCLVFDGNEKVGTVTSGTHSPTLGYPIAMIRAKRNFDKKEVLVKIRNRNIKAEIISLPFYKKDY